MNKQEILKQINIIRDWWFNLKLGFQDINKLDYTLQKLTGYYDYLCELLSNAYNDYLLKHEYKKIGLSKQEQKLMEKGESATAAKSIAPMMEETLLLEHVEKESEFYFLKNKKESTSKIIEAIKQRISNLKIEMKNI